MKEIAETLECPNESDRLEGLASFAERNTGGLFDRPIGEEVNNHVHTRYSFSPYSPSSVAYHARLNGLGAVGSVDHDSISAGREMREAARIVGIGSTRGCELRVDFSETPFVGRTLNNPDSAGIAYIVLHGVPDSGLKALEVFLKPLVAARERRTEQELYGVNCTLFSLGLESLDYEQDVRSLSWVDRGGTITERHLLYAMSTRILESFSGDEEKLIPFLRTTLGLTIPVRIEEYFTDPKNQHIVYDLLGVLKSQYLPEVFVQPGEDESIPVGRVVDFARSIGAIPAYAYLGDVEDSPTGDKAAQRFEDSYLEELFPVLLTIGFQAITYMPPRNTVQQLKRVQNLCSEFGLMEISGVDINSSRQKFTCPEILLPEFRHLNKTTWALIAHEHLTSFDEKFGIFHPENPMISMSMGKRIEKYAAMARSTDPFMPEKIANYM